METGMLRLFVRSFGLLLLALPLLSHAQQWGETVKLRGPLKEDLYLAGGQVDVSGGVDGDVSAAGGRVTIEDRVSGDVAAFGGTIHLRAGVKDDARLTGAEITVSGQIGDDLLAAGGDVTVAPEARIGGRAWLAGGRVEVAGRIGKELKAAGGELVIAGEVLGDVDLIGETIVIRPGAVIHGQLRYRSPNEAQIDPGARILGAVVAAPIEARPPRAGHTGGRVFMVLSLLACAAVCYLLFPGISRAAARQVSESPWTNLGLGFAVLAAGPLAVLLLLMSLVGLWLGLIALALYLTLLLLGYLTGVLFLAEAGLRRARYTQEHGRWWMIGALAAALILLSLLRLVPVAGALASFVLMLFGLGALTRALWRRYTAKPVAARIGTALKRRLRRT
jgi:cytoskeletal protein CcmA (bactofilin family)